MSLAARVGLRLGDLDLDAGLHAAPGETVVVVGPNGAGKSTLLRALAGLIPLASGRVELGGRVLEDASAGIRVRSEDRPVGLVFQESLLFPHLSVEGNVAFGLREAGASRRAAREAATGWLERVGLAGLGGRRPAALSGGQQRRAAIARALARGPHLLMLDEPFGGLDAAARAALRRELRRHLKEFGGVRLLVTHDPLEALALGDRLVVLEAGRVVQSGPAAEVAAHPRSAYVAELVGVNLVAGRGRGDRLELAGGAMLAAAESAEGEVLAVIHPRAVALHRERPEGSPRNVWLARVSGLELLGGRVRVAVAGPVPLVSEVTAAAAAALRLAEGEPVWVSIKATEVSVYPA